MKKISKIFACVMAVAMVLTMNITAFASQQGSTNTNPSTGGTIKVEKNLKVKNATLTSVDGPGLTYNYAIAPETPSDSNGGTSITDGTNTSVVTIGPAGGVTLSASSVSWPKGTAVDASPTGADNIKDFNAVADVTKFSKPGIYRYKITESANPADPSTIGVTDADAAEVRYVDVYIENDTTGFKVAGMVLHEGSGNKKTFDASEFDTYNVKVTKVTTGSMADKNHQFPFAATVTDGSRYYFDGKGAEASAATSKTTTGSSSTTLKDGESFWMCGLSKVGVVTVTETNDTADTYTTAISGLATVTGADVAPSGTATTGNITTNQDGTVTFTNTLDTVSPTGVIMRFGPYVGMVLAAIAFGFIFKRTRKANSVE